MADTIGTIGRTLFAGSITVASDVEIGVGFYGGGTEVSHTFPFDELLSYAAGIGLAADQTGIQLDLDSLSENLSPATTDFLAMTQPGGNPEKVSIANLLANVTGTNLTVTESPTGVTVDSSTGTGDTIALADAVNSGAMSPAHYTKLEGIEDSANAYLHPNHTGGDCDSVGDGAITINADAVVTSKIANANVTEPKLAPDSVTTAKILDANVTLAKLATDATTNLGVTVNPSDIEITNTTGTNANVPLADGTASSVGLVEGFEKQKLEDTIYVTDYAGVDPTGATGSSTGIQAAITDAIAKDIRTIKFPKGIYLFDAEVTLPQDSGGAGKRFTIDFCDSRIQVNSDITMFTRTVANVTDSSTQNWMLTLKNARCVSLAIGQGQVFDIMKCSNVRIENMRCVNLRAFCRLVFCLHHVVINVNCSDVTFPYQIRGGDGIITGADESDSSSNVGTWIACRAQLNNAAAIGFDSSDSGNITYINCTCEGTLADTAIKHSASQSAPGSGAILARTNLTLINFWLEFPNTATLTNAIVLNDITQSTVDVNMFSFTLPDATFICKLTGDAKRSTIRFRDTDIFQANTASTGPWFDANIQTAINEKNRWIFENCGVQGATETIADPTRWVSGTFGQVPDLVEETTFQYNNNTVHNTYLTVPADSLLANSDAANDAIVKPIDSGTLPTDPPSSSLVLGWNSAGNLRTFNTDQIGGRISLSQNTKPADGSPTGIYIVNQGSDRGVYVSHGVGAAHQIQPFEVDGEWPPT